MNKKGKEKISNLLSHNSMRITENYLRASISDKTKEKTENERELEKSLSHRSMEITKNYLKL